MRGLDRLWRACTRTTAPASGDRRGPGQRSPARARRVPLRQAQRRGGVGPRRLCGGHDRRRPAPAAGTALRHHRRQARRGRPRSAGADLRLGQKLEAVGQLAAGIAHEINTPTQFVGDTVALPRRRLRRRHAPRGRLRAPARGRRAGPVPRAHRRRPPGRGARRPRLPPRARARRLRARRRRRPARGHHRPRDERVRPSADHRQGAVRHQPGAAQHARRGLATSTSTSPTSRRISASCRRSCATAATSTRCSSTWSSTRPTPSRT